VALDAVDALLAQDLLHALDRVALGVQQLADAAQQLEILRPVIAPAAAALHRPDLRELDLPEPQDVLGHLEVVGDLADRAERCRSLAHCPLPPPDFAPPAATAGRITWSSKGKYPDTEQRPQQNRLPGRTIADHALHTRETSLNLVHHARIMVTKRPTGQNANRRHAGARLVR
jgi:hypothetical protein